MGRSVGGRENSGQKRQREEERNPDVDPRLMLMEIFREFFYETNRDSKHERTTSASLTTAGQDTRP